jgi:hypothetical protein
MICPTAKAKYFFKKDWTGRNSLIGLKKIAWPRTPDSAPRA